MNTITLVEKLTKIFIEEAYGKPATDIEILSINHGIQLTLISDPMNYLRTHYQISSEGWIRPQNLSWENGYLGDETAPNWDVKLDGSEIVHCVGPFSFYFYKVVQLTDNEIKILNEEKIKNDIEKVQREKALSILKENLIIKTPSLNYLFTGDLEINHGIHLKEIKRGMHMVMPFKPRYGNTGWVCNQVLGWGSNIGWDITLDGKIVCCRVHYDDYINFEVVILNETEIKEFKIKYTKADNLMVNRMATLKELLNQALITQEEYETKKQSMLNLI